MHGMLGLCVYIYFCKSSQAELYADHNLGQLCMPLVPHLMVGESFQHAVRLQVPCGSDGRSEFVVEPLACKVENASTAIGCKLLSLPRHYCRPRKRKGLRN